MKKIFIAVIIVIILVALAYWQFGDAPEEETLPESQALLDQDTTSEILGNLEGIDLGDLDQEFQDIDAELDQL